MTFDTLTCAAAVGNLDQVIEFAEGIADRIDFETQKKFGMLIAVEEAFVNVCHYAYPEGEGDVTCTCNADAESFVVEIADRGEAFDVLTLPDPDITLDILDRDIGGLGVHFIRKLSDEVSYRRENGQNILRMIFRRTAGDLP